MVVMTNCGAKEIVSQTYDSPRSLTRGAELGVFELGSTVILIVQPQVHIELSPLPRAVLYGARLGAVAPLPP